MNKKKRFSTKTTFTDAFADEGSGARATTSPRQSLLFAMSLVRTSVDNRELNSSKPICAPALAEAQSTSKENQKIVPRGAVAYSPRYLQLSEVGPIRSRVHPSYLAWRLSDWNSTADDATLLSGALGSLRKVPRKLPNGAPESGEKQKTKNFDREEWQTSHSPRSPTSPLNHEG